MTLPSTTLPSTTAMESVAAGLCARYNFAWDRLDAQAVSACFTPDGVFVGASGEPHRGTEEIEAFVRLSPSIFGPKMRHMTLTHMVESADEQTGTHTCYLIFVAWTEDGERTISTGVYEDTLQNTPDGWRFRKRVVRLD
ncbi:nuclear transport factor 2 family protein [Rhodococcus sp. NPDC057529]|uniref:nuclear transport factor 2 family protein n=1 Tax=Rhodococcus sp. NPDC057529 TaxID=3346158 RepID=UPI0036716B86